MEKHVERQSDWWTVRILVAIFVPFIGSYTLFEPFGRDHGIHATIAFALDEGLVTYRDVYNIKPPLTTAMHWLSQALFGHSMMAIRALDLIVASLAALGLVEIGRQLGRKPVFGISCAIGFSVLYYSYGYWEHAQTDGWAGFLVIPALLLMITGWARPNGKPRFGMMFAAGAILGAAFCFKYTIGGAGVLVFTPIAVNLLGKDEIRFHFSDFFACLIGGVSTLFVIVMVLVSYGAWTDFSEIQKYVMSYVGYTNEEPNSSLVGFLLPKMLSGYAIGGVFVGLLVATSEWIKNKRATVLIISVLWIFAGWLSGAVQGKGFAYHFLPLVPAYAFLIGIAVEYFTDRMESFLRPSIAASVLLLLLYFPSKAATLNSLGIKVMAAENRENVYIGWVGPTTDFDFMATVDFAKTLDEHHKPDDSLFLWGFETMLYFMLETPPRYKYPYSWPFVVGHNDGRYDQDLMSRLKADPPTRIVVQSQDATPWATGNPRSSEEQLPHFPEFQRFLDKNYSQIEQNPRFKLFERNSAGF